MSLSSIYLDAFAGVVKHGSFSKASKALFITQSALSQRILNFEDELGVTLFIRESTGIRMTEAGEKLLQYTRLREKLESNVLDSIQGEAETGVSGEIRIGSLSSLTRSLLYPCLNEFLRENPALHVEIYSRELAVLDPMARRGEIDLIVSYHPMERQGWKHELIGREENVLCQSSRHKSVAEKFFDHDFEDNTTQEFFNLQSKKPKEFRRDYLHDIYHIIDAVERGWGKAVIPHHLINGNKKITVSKSHKTLTFPIYLSYPDVSYYPTGVRTAIDLIREHFKNTVPYK